MQKRTLLGFLLIALLTVTGTSCRHQMSLSEKVGQLFVVAYSPNYNTQKQIERLIRKDHLGGIILMECPMDGYADVWNALQRNARIPLAISVDGEWGAAMRFDTLTPFPKNMQLGALPNDSLVYEVGLGMAKQFRRLGIHINYAPSVDINNNPLNPVIGPRSFGDNREKVATYGAALMRGLRDGGVWTSAKHFPGHGDTETDSHKSLPQLSFDRRRLDSMELYPFVHLIQEGVPMVMVGHLNVPALDTTGTPSSLSYPIIHDVLKQQLHFNGLVVTDALEMEGVARFVEQPEEVALRSFMAGSDILLMPPGDPHRSIKRLCKAVRQGQVNRERVDESVRKILAMKAEMGLLATRPVLEGAHLFQDVESPQVLDLIQRVCDASVTQIKPISRPEPLQQLLQQGVADTVFIPKNASLQDLEQARARTQGKALVVVFVPEFKAQKNNREQLTPIPPAKIYDFLSHWATEQPLVLAVMDTPYVLNHLDIPAFDGLYVGYSSSDANKRAVLKILNQEKKAQGVLPVQVQLP